MGGGGGGGGGGVSGGGGVGGVGGVGDGGGSAGGDHLAGDHLLNHLFKLDLQNVERGTRDMDIAASSPKGGGAGGAKDRQGAGTRLQHMTNSGTPVDSVMEDILLTAARDAVHADGK